MLSEDDLRELERKTQQLKLDYERYFLGTRPREPVMLRQDVDKLIVVHGSSPIQNTAMRFKFNSICSRFHALKRQWNETLRKMEAGTYERHRFRADLRERDAGAAAAPSGAAADAAPDDDLYSSYRDARLACGQAVESLSRAKLEATVAQQRSALEQRFGPGTKVRFRVAVENGKAKLKASRVR